MPTPQKGLFKKFRVIRTSTGEEVEEPSFTLLPMKDQAARTALQTYAEAVEERNPELANDLEAWVQDIEEEVE